MLENKMTSPADIGNELIENMKRGHEIDRELALRQNNILVEGLRGELARIHEQLKTIQLQLGAKN